MANRIPPGTRRSLTAITASTAFANGAAPQTLNGAALSGETIQAGTLGALVTVDAETNTLTIAAKWQVSTDNSTWYDCAGTPNNAADVVLATGTSGADAAVTKNIPAPDCVYAWPYVRLQLVTGVGSADGTNDIGGATYRYISAGAYSI